MTAPDTHADVIRRCIFTPYLPGKGPRFRLTVWDAHRRDSYGKSILGYRLKLCEPGTVLVVFEGEDFGCSPMHGIDSDETIAGLMGFLTCRPGDTDSKYFANYTPAQLEFCTQHAESLSCEVDNRFGENR